MSASERLREISRLAPATHWKPRDVLFDALLELIAVVEAAEREALYEVRNGVGHYDLTERIGGELGRALAALDAKLTTEENR